MKKLTLAAALAASLVAVPALADANDPFVSTQGEFGIGLGAIAATTLFIIVAASDGT